jgi:methionine-gamma-lyase
MVITPVNLGADIVVHSLTKFINGASDTMGGAVCASQDFINALMDVNDGAAMLLGPAMDGVRSASILKNLRTLHLRMMQHGKNAKFLAEKLTQDGMKIKFPGLKDHPQHDLMNAQMNPEFGYSGMLLFDLGTKKKAYEFMYEMQEENVGYLAVSLGFYKTLFSAPGSSTSSEISEEEQKEMNLSEGYVRMSVGIDMDIERTYEKMNAIAKKIAVI